MEAKSSENASDNLQNLGKPKIVYSSVKTMLSLNMFKQSMLEWRRLPQFPFFYFCFSESLPWACAPHILMKKAYRAMFWRRTFREGTPFSGCNEG
jgi:hypothetical protein